MGKCEGNSFGSRWLVVDTCECCNDRLGSRNSWTFFVYLSNCWLLKEDLCQLSLMLCLTDFVMESVHSDLGDRVRFIRRLQWLCSLRHELSSLAWTRGLSVRISLKAWISGCVYFVFVLSSVDSGLAMGWSPVQGVLTTVYGIKKQWKNSFHKCLLLQSGRNRKKRKRDTFDLFNDAFSNCEWVNDKWIMNLKGCERTK
jgi:hypothetical protein